MRADDLDAARPEGRALDEPSFHSHQVRLARQVDRAVDEQPVLPAGFDQDLHETHVVRRAR
jgi:hypothetical protein